MMSRETQTSCPSDQGLIELLESDTHDGELHQHVEGCPKCQRRMDQLCDPGLANRWQGLLADDESRFRIDTAEIPTDASTVAGGASLAPTHSMLPSVEGYDLDREIGRGGMGVVYEATHRDLDRSVALKMLISGALAGPERLARFQREAQAIAKLSHANIVQIFDVGEHQGLPYFALELVPTGSLEDHLDGTPWNAFAAAEFMRHAADGIEVAHQAGLVHRDIKPANLLVVKQTGMRSAWQPKITDFGLAKGIADETLTRSGIAVGTPRYLSPEQAVGKESEIHAASDVYALGCILYQLLTGRPPFQAETVPETIRMICDAEPIDVRRLNPSVPRDLATICHKCLLKQPGQRYASARELSEDLQRFENQEPIRARPVGRVEKLAKWSRRNPMVATMSVVLGIGLIVVVVGWLDFTRRLAAQTKRAEANATTAQQREREAVDAADATSEVTRFLTKDLLQAVAPSAAGIDVTVYDVLMAADRELENQFVDRPRVEAEIRSGIAESFQAIGAYRNALPHARRALQLNEKQYAADALQVIKSKILLAELHSSLSETDVALSIVAELERLDDSLDERTRTDIAATRGGALFSAGRFGEARDLFESLYQQSRQRYGDDDEITLAMLSHYARSRHETGDLKGAHALLSQYRDQVIEVFGEADLKSIEATRDLGVSYAMTGRIQEALQMQKANYDICRDVYGSEHPTTNSGLHNYALALSRNKRYDDARPLLEKAVQVSIDTLGPNHETTINFVGNLAYMHYEFGYTERAAQCLEAHCDPLIPQAFDHPNWGVLLLTYGRVRQRLGELEEAQRLYQLSGEIFERSTGTTELMRKTLQRSLNRVKQQMEQKKKR